MIGVGGMAAVTAAEATATAQRTVTAEEPLPLIEEPLKISPKDARELSRQFFDRLAMLEEGTHEF
jgi:RNA polymerase sigma-B factor